MVLRTPALTLDRNNGVVAYGTTVTFTAALGVTSTNRVVEIWTEDHETHYNQLLKRATVNSAGKVTASLKMTRNTTVTAKFSGDAGYAARTVKSIVYAKVKVKTELRGHYKTKKVGSTKYSVFRKKVKPKIYVSMTANYPARHHRIVLQRYSGGKWRVFSDNYFPLSVQGYSSLRLTGNHPVGSKWRIRSEYTRGRSGDSFNYTTTEATWQYLTFSK